MVLYRTEDDSATVSALIKDETIWITQKAMAELFGIDKSGISRHLAIIFEQANGRNESIPSVPVSAESGNKLQIFLQSAALITRNIFQAEPYALSFSCKNQTSVSKPAYLCWDGST